MADVRALRMLEFECRALLTRLDRIKPFALLEPMVPAAAPSADARDAVDRYLTSETARVQGLVSTFRVHVGRAEEAAAESLGRRFVFLRMRFNSLLADFDTFADVMTQRSETKNGVWLAGLDVAASDGLSVPGVGLGAPPVMCFLDRGHGAAIRRARTRLATGDNPVAIVRIPRERMVGGGITSSLMHEVGHQAVALLDVLPSLRAALQAKQLLASDAEKPAWRLWELWISEIVADFWAILQVGITATLGLIAVVSLPRVFVFRIATDDPHPAPWIRVLLSCALGRAIFPHVEWERAAGLWKTLYPVRELQPQQLQILNILQATMQDLVRLLMTHRPPSLRGQTMPQALRISERTPETLRDLWGRWRSRPADLIAARPTLTLAVLGQARADGRLGPENEAEVLERLFGHWALRRARWEASPRGTKKSGCGCQRKAPRTSTEQEFGETYG